VPRHKEEEIVGKAVLVTEPSRAESSNGMQRAMKERQKPNPRVHFSDGLSDELIEGIEAGIEGREGFSVWAVEWWVAEGI
jgi:hypothetical protein